MMPRSGFIPLFIILFRIKETRHKKVYGCRKNVRIPDRFFDNHYKTASNKHQSGVTTRNGGGKYVF
jgi:hypothetical protein